MTAPDPLTSESPSIMDSFVDPRNRFDAIERDAASLLISETDTSMSTTVHGLGAFSGRAIMRMGEYTLRGITGVVIKWKLSDISAKIQRKDPQDWPPGLLDHVLELQRIVLYPDSSRRDAWNLIFIVMEKKYWKPLSEALKIWPYIETQLFLQQLATCKLSGWTSHPVRGNVMAKPTERIPKAGSSQYSLREEALSESLVQILLALLQKDSIMLHETFNLDTFTRLLSDRISVQTGPHIGLALFFNSFASVQPFLGSTLPDILQKIPEILTSYPSVDALIQYLLTCPPEQDKADMQLVVDHIITSVKPFASLVDLRPERTKMVYRMHPNLKTSTFHPTWPFLCFAILLTWRSPAATHMFICSDIIKVLEDLSHRYREKPMCLIYLGLLIAMSKHHDLTQCTLKRNLESWLAGKHRHRTSVIPLPELSTSNELNGESVPRSISLSSNLHSPSSEQLPVPQAIFPQSLETDYRPQDESSSSLRYIIAEALAVARGAVELDSRMEVKAAVKAYAKSAAILSEAIFFKGHDRTPMQRDRIRQMREIYGAYISRINILCRAYHIPLPPLPTSLQFSSPAVLGPSTSDLSAPPPYSLTSLSDSPPLNRLRERNSELLTLWRSNASVRASEAADTS